MAVGRYNEPSSTSCLLTKPLADNTNRDRDARAHWVKVAHEFKIPIRCILLTASARLAEHNDMVRSLNKSVSLSFTEDDRSLY